MTVDGTVVEQIAASLHNSKQRQTRKLSALRCEMSRVPNRPFGTRIVRREGVEIASTVCLVRLAGCVDPASTHPMKCFRKDSTPSR